MGRENELLSIGEVAKLTGISVQALRYYERKNIIKPVYTNPDSGYRYYSPNQIYFIQLTINCVNLDIPLKELVGVFNSDDMTGLREFTERNMLVAEKKAKLINASIIGYKAILERMELANLYDYEKIHSRQYPEKNYFLKSLESPQKDEKQLKLYLKMAKEIYGENFNHITIDDNLDEVLGFADIGTAARHSLGKVEYFTLVEVTKQIKSEHCISLPSATCFFRFDENSQLENAPQIFKEHLVGVDEFMIIETEEPLLSRSKINQPAYELRLVVL